METVKFNFACPSCGSEKFIQPSESEPEAQTTCANCGRVISQDDVNDAALKRAKELAPEIAADFLRKAFKK